MLQPDNAPTESSGINNPNRIGVYRRLSLQTPSRYGQLARLSTHHSRMPRDAAASLCRSQAGLPFRYAMKLLSAALSGGRLGGVLGYMLADATVVA